VLVNGRIEAMNMRNAIWIPSSHTRQRQTADKGLETEKRNEIDD
jgi:hypothetical protein